MGMAAASWELRRERIVHRDHTLTPWLKQIGR
jgi:hypothetical protein